jgi:hypothetical protein
MAKEEAGNRILAQEIVRMAALISIREEIRKIIINMTLIGSTVGSGGDSKCLLASFSISLCIN